MAKPKPVPEAPEPKEYLYEVLQPLLDKESGRMTLPGATLTMREDLAEKFIRGGALIKSRKQPTKPKPKKEKTD